jgi:hypothetical protein
MIISSKPLERRSTVGPLKFSRTALDYVAGKNILVTWPLHAHDELQKF